MFPRFDYEHEHRFTEYEHRFTEHEHDGIYSLPELDSDRLLRVRTSVLDDGSV